MKNRFETIIAMGVSMLCFAFSASAGNIVVNGSFEGATYTGPNNDVVPTGWTVGPPSFLIQSMMNVESVTDPSTFLGPEDGSDYIRFQSPSTEGRDCLYQDLATTAGQEYEISFWVAITSTSVANNLGLDVEWDENTANQTALDDPLYSVPTNTGPVNYQQFSYLEVASGTDTRIDFHGVDSNGSILLDNVSVEAVSSAPEPFSFLLAGSGLLMAGLIRKRSSKRG